MRARPEINHDRRACVIGAGFGGMAAALRLRAMGYAVTLLERQPDLGGRARVFRQDGFTFDAGPTVITAPYLFEELFALFGKTLADHVEMMPLCPWYRFLFADGSHFDYADEDATLQEIARLCPEDQTAYPRFLAHCKDLFSFGYERLAHAPMNDPLQTAFLLPAMIRRKVFQSVYTKTKRIFSDPRLKQAMAIQPLLLGGSPMQTTSIYLLIHALEQKWGVWFPKGGTGALVHALDTLMREQGIVIETGRTVTKLHRQGNIITAVETEDGHVRHFDIVVSNLDPLVLEGLIKQPRQFSLPRPRRRSFGLFIVYFGTSRIYHHVQHHTILMGPDFETQIGDLFRKKRVDPDNLSIYLHRPTATDPTLAPAGHDGFYALIPVPDLGYISEKEWEGGRKGELKDTLYETLEARLLPDLRRHIITEKLVTPAYFANDLLAFQGCGFSLAPLFTQSGFFRYHNRNPFARNLYLVGAGTHPGAGVPGVLNSAKVVESILKKDMMNNRVKAA